MSLEQRPAYQDFYLKLFEEAGDDLRHCETTSVAILSLAIGGAFAFVSQWNFDFLVEGNHLASSLKITSVLNKLFMPLSAYLLVVSTVLRVLGLKLKQRGRIALDVRRRSNQAILTLVGDQTNGAELPYLANLISDQSRLNIIDWVFNASAVSQVIITVLVMTDAVFGFQSILHV